MHIWYKNYMVALVWLDFQLFALVFMIFGLFYGICWILRSICLARNCFLVFRFSCVVACLPGNWVYLYILALKVFQGEAIVSLVEKLVLKLVIHWLAMVAPWLMFHVMVIVSYMSLVKMMEISNVIGVENSTCFARKHLYVHIKVLCMKILSGWLMGT